MVCKEDVLSWFKDLESYKRIDVLYELLNMCLPFELRFLGSCVEEIGKQTYLELRGPAIQANDLEKLQKDNFFNGGILDEEVRHRVLIYLSLLTSRNYSVANWMCKTLLRTDRLEDFIAKGSIKDDNTQSEFLLLYVMALHHPAFTFDQKLFFGKMLSLLLEFKERNRLSPKPTAYGYPPGFGYPTVKSQMCAEPPNIPVKISSAMPCGDEFMHQQPPAFVHGPPPTQEFVAWSRPGFPCGAPDSVPPPFPGPNMSPLVSQSTSPIHSRSSSPHRTIVSIRPTPLPPPPIGGVSVTVQSAQPPPPCDPIPPPQIDQFASINSYPPFVYPTENQIKMPAQLDDELNSIPEEKFVGDINWLSKDLNKTNGLRFHHPLNHHQAHHQPNKGHRTPYNVIEQLQTLNIDGHLGDGCLQRSNSSSNSSLNQTPPETPTTITSRGDGNTKSRCNGMPPPTTTPTTMLGPMCEPTSPPPPPPQQQQQQQQHTFNNSVPYTTYPTMAMPPRNLFPYNTQPPYRPPFTAHYPTYQNENSYPNPTYTIPYTYIYSGAFPQSRNTNCFNCGAVGHLGQDCTGQNIEDITQKKTYTLEYTPPPLPDSDK